VKSLIKENQKIEITVGAGNIKHFEGLGYNIKGKMRKKVIVNAKDLPKGSHSFITYVCDFCGTDFTRQVKEREYTYKNSPFDSCSNCKNKKREQTNLLKFGTKTPAENKDIVKKMEKTNIERYGVRNASLHPHFIDKIVKVKQENGTINSFGKMKIVNGVFASTGQVDVSNSLGGKVNVLLFNKCIDIVLFDEKIAIEYDGSGHKMSVTLGSKSEEEFNKSDEDLEVKILENGWKFIRIINYKDKTIDSDYIRNIVNDFIDSDKYNLHLHIS
jgi:very-short-patch-repair endonuclease